MKRILLLGLYALCGTINAIQCNQERFVLITFLYNEKFTPRIMEYKGCIIKNLKHPAIESIHVIYDPTDDDQILEMREYLQSNRNIRISYCEGRPTFRYCIDLANKCYPGRKIILANADIYFDETLNKLLDVSFENRVFACTRRDVRIGASASLLYLEGEIPNEFSQDAWIFQTPMRDIGCGDLQLGTPHCERLFAHAAHQAGLSLYNPCLSIKCYHLHFSGVRHYTEIPVPPGGMPIPWCRIEDIPAE